MTTPHPSDALASISSTIYTAATAAYSTCAESSTALYSRCALFVSSASSPAGRAKISSAAAEIPRIIADDATKFVVAWGVGASVFAAGLAITPRAARLLQLRNADRIRALVFGCAGVTASGAAATVASLAIMQQPTNFTSAIRSSWSPVPSDEHAFSWVWPVLPGAEVALLCGALSLLTFRASGGRARYILPSDLCVGTRVLPPLVFL
jgi:hypothetical protein